MTFVRSGRTYSLVAWRNDECETESYPNRGMTASISVLHRTRRAIQRLGLDIRRYPVSDPLFQVVRLLRHLGVDSVLDIGANAGQFGGEMRRLGYVHRMVSIEPLSLPFATLERACANDALWECQRVAVGPAAGEATINVAGNSVSSSMLPMLERHVRSARRSAYVGSERVRVTTIDELMDRYALRSHTYVKIDVQGFERQVLDGAIAALGVVRAVQLELSLVPLYAGAWSFDEAMETMRGRGFMLAALLPGFSDPVTAQTLQCDGVFTRRDTD
jgi:FkbM family methyltransferase